MRSARLNDRFHFHTRPKRNLSDPEGANARIHCLPSGNKMAVYRRSLRFLFPPRSHYQLGVVDGHEHSILVPRKSDTDGVLMTVNEMSPPSSSPVNRIRTEGAPAG